jgi:DNA-binding NtrC family response regulator
VRAKLNRNGCRVLTAKDVSEAEEKWAMARDIIDLVISDNKLGSDRGVDLVQRFQQQEPGVQFILCSGEPIEEPLPGVPFVQKPFGIDQIGIPSSAAVK